MGKENVKTVEPKNLNNNSQRTSVLNYFKTMNEEEKIGLLFLIGIMFLVVLIRSKFLLIPFERDEGAYAYYGKLILEGKTPYVDFYEQKFPGVFYFYSFIVFVFGHSVKQLHMGFMFLNLASILFIYLAVKRMFSPSAGVISALTFAITSLIPNISGFTIQSEHGVAFFTCLGIFLYTKAYSTKKWYYYFAMGLAMGCAFMIKTTGIFIAFWGGVALIIDYIFNKERKFKELLVHVFQYIAGFILVIGVLFLLIYSKGSFNEMLFWTVELPKYYVNRIPLEEGLKYFGYTKDAIFQNYKLICVHALLAIVLCLIKSVSYRVKVFSITLAACSFFTIVPGYYFYGHYWLQMLPGLAFLAGLTFYCVMMIFEKTFKLNYPKLKYLYVGLFVVFSLIHINKMKAYYFKPNYERILRTVYGGNPFPETMEIANYLNTQLAPNDKIAVLGSEPELFIYTDKMSATRHIFFSTVVASLPQHKKWQREYSAEIEKEKPKYFVAYNVPISILRQADTDEYVFNWANKYITENYHLIGLVDMIEGQHATYLWREQIGNYRPVSQNVIFIYERNK